MRLVSYLKDGTEKAGMRRDDDIAELPVPMLALLAMPRPERDKLLASAQNGARVGFNSVKLLPPVPRPGKILCLGLNYYEHRQETGNPDKPLHPVVFMRSATSLVAHGEPILLPAVSAQLDYEAEMVAVIGTPIRNATAANALDAVFGYSVFNDGSVRDYQRLTPQWTLGKNFDRTGGFGPELVTADEVPPGGAGLSIRTRLNGAVMQDANTRDMIFNVQDIIVRLTEVMTLEPGDILVTGTPGGVGMARKPPVWMKTGDICEIEIERLGILRNPIAE